MRSNLDALAIPAPVGPGPLESPSRHATASPSARGVVWRVLVATTALVALLSTSVAEAHLSIIRQGGEAAGALEAGDRTGEALAAGDFNGDGYDDLAMGAPGDDIGSHADAGAVIVCFGSRHGLTHIGSFSITANTIGQASQAGAQFGWSLISRDFNRDGYADLVIGAPYEDVAGQNSAGRIYCVYGFAGGLQSSSVAFDQGDASAGVEALDRFGYALAAGNFNGDAGGYPDLAVGAPGENGDAGAVSINFFGGPVGITSGLATTVTEAPLGTPETGDSFGYAIAGGNMVGSAADDLAIGVPYDNIYGTANAGRVFLLRGSSSGITTASWSDVEAGDKDSRQAEGTFGYAVAAGQFFGGSYRGLAIGEPGRSLNGLPNAGRVLVFKGTLSGLDFTGTNGRILTENSGGSGVVQAGDRFGRTLAAGDYWDASGYDDVAIGAPGDGLGFTTYAGQFQIFPGGPDGPTGAGWSGFNQGTCNEPAETGDYFGDAIAYGRFDATNRGGFAVGAPGERVESPIWGPIVFLENAGMVHDISPWRQSFGLTTRTAAIGECADELLFSQKPFERVKIASTTKVMTVLMACEAIDAGQLGLGSVYTVPSWVASNSMIGGSQSVPPLATGETVTLEGLMYLTIFHSGNDAAHALADFLEGGEGQSSQALFIVNVATFVNRMNQRAAQLGMSGTSFTNPNGFDKAPSWLGGGSHYSTAYDMWLLSKAAMQNARFRSVADATTYSIVRSGNTTQITYSWNVVNQPGVIGIKPGGTPLGRSTGVWAAQALLGSVIGGGFGNPDGTTHFNDAMSLLNLGLGACSFQPIVPKNEPTKITLAGASTLAGALSSNGFGLDGSGSLDVDVFRQTGSSPTSARIEIGRISQVTLAPGEHESFGIGPFRRHLGYSIGNPDIVPIRLRLVTNGTVPIEMTVPAESTVVIAPYTSPTLLSFYGFTLENPDPATTIAFSMQEHYAFDETLLGGPDTQPARTYRLTRGTHAFEEGGWVQVVGLDPNPGSSLFLAAHDPRLTVDVPAVPSPSPPVGLLKLLPPAPNPFRVHARIGFELASPAQVEVEVLDLQGRLVRELVDARFVAGRASVEWDGSGADGRRARAGVYWVRVRANGAEAGDARIVLVR